jgi:hypothetical protein
MNTTLQNLVGKEVTVIMRTTGYMDVQGKLLESDDTFLVVEQAKKEMVVKCVIPLTSVLYFFAMPVLAAKRSNCNLGS